MTGTAPAAAAPLLRASAAPLLSRIAACLHDGGVALLFVPVDGGGVVGARDAVRARCTELLAALAAQHRLRPHASRSATPGLAAVALGSSAALGVDVERLRPEWVDDDLLALALHADERLPQLPVDGVAHHPAAAARRFFAAWTRKEAVMKALGLGLALPPASFCAGPPTADWHQVRTPAGASRVRSVAVARRTGAAADDEFAAALAVSAEHGLPSAVRTFWLRPDDDLLAA